MPPWCCRPTATSLATTRRRALSASQVVWASNTSGDTTLTLQLNGNVVLQASTSLAEVSTWRSGTSTGAVPHAMLLTAGQYLQSTTGQYKLAMATSEGIGSGLLNWVLTVR